MAITQRAAGTWAEFTADATVAIPAGAQAGDRMYLLAAWKDFSVTATVSGWTEQIENANGTTVTGNGTGSVKTGCWYKDHSGSESDPTFDITGAAALIGGAVIVVFQKDASETWDAPTHTVRSITAATNWSTTAVSPFGSVDKETLVVGVVGFQDDSATMTRSSTTGIRDDGTTWSTNYTEYPATHFSTTTGNDLSADAGYRIASGGTMTSLTMSGTLSASESGSGVFIFQTTTTVAAANPDYAPKVYPQLLPQ